MVKKRKYMDVNVPRQWEPYFKEELAKPEIQKSLELSNQSVTYSGLGVWIIWSYLVEKTSFRFQHLNVKDNHITIIDNKLRRIIDIYIKPSKELWCDYDQSNKCEHVQFVMTIDAVKKALAG